MWEELGQIPSSTRAQPDQSEASQLGAATQPLKSLLQQEKDAQRAKHLSQGQNTPSQPPGQCSAPHTPNPSPRVSWRPPQCHTSRGGGGRAGSAGAWELIYAPAESALFLSLQPGHHWNSPPALRGIKG